MVFGCGYFLGIQHREVAASGSREEEDQTRVRTQRETSGRSQEDVIFSHLFWFVVVLLFCALRQKLD